MPKHVPTFKHLIATSSSREQDRNQRERTVNEILQASREQQRNVRDAPPHLRSARGQGPWSSATPSVAELASGEAEIHPAELVRREEVAYRQASRSVAGPAPPRSWRPAIVDKGPRDETVYYQRDAPTEADLRCSATFFAPPQSAAKRTTGSERLVEYCLRAVLRYMNSEVILGDSVEDEDQVLLGDVMRDQAAYLDSHLKAGLLDMSSFMPLSDPLRMSDRSIRAILTSPLERGRGKSEWEDETEDVDWGDTDPTLHRLPMIQHPAPTAILRHLPSLSALSLTSLNLAYSTLADPDRLAAVLPVGLRELSLCGVRMKGGDMRLADGDAWRRALGAMARKLIVLTKLDLSEAPFPYMTHTFTTLLHPPQVRLPSLRLLALRDRGARMVSEGDRKKLATFIRGEGRQRYIDIIWD